MNRLLCALAAALFAVCLTSAPAYCAGPAPRMTKETLLPLLDNPDVAVVDVRTPIDWESSDTKIRGAIRIDPDQKLSRIISQLPHKRVLIFY